MEWEDEREARMSALRRASAYGVSAVMDTHMVGIII